MVYIVYVMQSGKPCIKNMGNRAECVEFMRGFDVTCGGGVHMSNWDVFNDDYVKKGLCYNMCNCNECNCSYCECDVFVIVPEHRGTQRTIKYIICISVEELGECVYNNSVSINGDPLCKYWGECFAMLSTTARNLTQEGLNLASQTVDRYRMLEVTTGLADLNPVNIKNTVLKAIREAQQVPMIPLQVY